MAKPRKVEKVEEPAGAYSATPSSAAAAAKAVRYARRADVLKTNEHLMKVHRRVLEKLAK